MNLPPVPQATAIVGSEPASPAWFAWFNAIRGIVLLLQTHVHIVRSNPNGSEVGSVGHLALNVSGGAGSTLWVKESGTNTTTGWVAK